MFFDINPACFRSVVYYLNERKITPPGSNLRSTHVGKYDDIVLQQLMLSFGLEGDGIIHYEKSVKKLKVRENKDKWKNIKFKKIPRGKPYDIQTVLQREQKFLLGSND